MSSLFQESGLWSIDYTYGKRRRIRLGNVTEKQARQFGDKLEQLLSANALGTPVAHEVALWLTTIDPKLHSHLVNAGLTTLRIDTLGELLSAWRSALKPKTANGSPVVAIVQNLLEYFGPHARLRSITAPPFERWLESQDYAKATISRRLRLAKQAFSFAVENRSVADNPFAKCKGNEINHDHDFDVTVKIMDALLDACPNVEFRALLCLVRFGGVRCPSEVKGMRWTQIHWHNDTFIASGPKTGSRPVPMFKELRDAMSDLWDDAGEKVEWIFPNLQSHAHTTAKFKALCKRAGITPWNRTFDNMRASCITDWMRAYHGNRTIAEIAAWAGHSPKTLMDHYEQIRHEDRMCGTAFVELDD